MPVLGGLLADRWLGMRRAVVSGSVLLVLGHFGLAFEGDPATRASGAVARNAGALRTMYVSLALIVVGVGFLKPNISTIVGKLYADDDPRRDSASRCSMRPSTSARRSLRWCAASSARSMAGAMVSARPASACWSGWRLALAAQQVGDSGAMASEWWLVLAYFVLEVGEMCLARSAPPRSRNPRCRACSA